MLRSQEEAEEEQEEMSLSLLRKDPVYELDLNRALLAGNQRRLAAVPHDSVEAVRLEVLCNALAKEVRWWQRQVERELLEEGANEDSLTSRSPT